MLSIFKGVKADVFPGMHSLEKHLRCGQQCCRLTVGAEESLHRDAPHPPGDTRTLWGFPRLRAPRAELRVRPPTAAGGLYLVRFGEFEEEHRHFRASGFKQS